MSKMRFMGMVVGVILVLSGMLGAQTWAASSISGFGALETKVAVLPVVGLDGVKQYQTDSVYNELQALFAERSFQVIRSSKVIESISKFGISEFVGSPHVEDTLRKVAEAVGADVVVFVIVTDSDRPRNDYCYDRYESGCEYLVGIRLWLVDMRDKSANRDGNRYEAVHRSIFKKSSTLLAEATRNAVRLGLRNYLASYKVIEPLKRSITPSPKLDEIASANIAPASPETKP